MVDAGGDLLDLKRHGGWQSSAVAEGYLDNSLKSKVDASAKIASAIRPKNASIGQPANILTYSQSETSTNGKSENTFNSCSVTIINVTIINNYYYK